MSDTSSPDEQISLIPLLEQPEREGVGRVKQKRRPRTFDRDILRWVGYFEYVTLRQVIHRFWISRGRGGGYGFRCVRDLVGRNLLHQFPLDPERGRSSLHVLRLTPKGYLHLGLDPRPPRQGADLYSFIAYRIQAAEMMIVRASEGWSLISRRDQEGLVSALRTSELRRFRNRALDAHLVQERRRIQRLSAQNLRIPLDLLHHPDTDHVRFLLPVRRGRSYSRILDRVTELSFLSHASFELICADMDLLPQARGRLRRWGRKHKIEVDVHAPPHFRQRPHPLARRNT